jgi:hypothetical protein
MGHDTGGEQKGQDGPAIFALLLISSVGGGRFLSPHGKEGIWEKLPTTHRERHGSERTRLLVTWSQAFLFFLHFHT